MPLEALSTKVGSTAPLARFKHYLKSVEADDSLPEYRVALRDVIPSVERFDARGRRMTTPDTIVVMIPKGKPAPALIEAVAA